MTNEDIDSFVIDICAIDLLKKGSSIGSLILIYLVSLKFIYGLDIGDRPLLIAGTLLVVVGIQFISFGVIGEILSRTYFASSKEKSYFIRWNSDDKD